MSIIKEKALKAVLLSILICAGNIFVPSQVINGRGLPPNTFTIEGSVTGQANSFIPADQKLNSKLMGREMPYRVLLPKNYANDNQTRYPVIYLLHGLTGHYDNWSDKTKLAEYLAVYNFIIVTPEGNDGWYTDSATVPNDKYESYIVQELIPEVDKNLRTLADREHRVVAGLSMGGYGSLKFGLKYPEKFVLVGSFSGALGAAGWTKAYLDKMGIKGAIPASLTSVYGADESRTRKENNVYEIAKNLTPEKIKALPFVYQSCGTEDFLIQDNRSFLALMNEKKIAHEYRERPGVHNWDFWDAEVNDFLRIAARLANNSTMRKFSGVKRQF